MVYLFLNLWPYELLALGLGFATVYLAFRPRARP
ncbi:unknown protein [Azorhizobium caulinodans ORS 571]|jgi:hypothetical protein|uniref:Transmembrane protein n=1 Tax=Azorhizobium caulinodans (strain ATCC 43989 / DSM 5975 / JCM 20966 / LMG 6465 / NBRC 14845 / NCIMB 13405 / ORS 571) TaxID=438753 RepID=A8HRN0_AZOC5|nr:hypothetical protein DFO45_3330 [Azorhizobium sp. AG788]BAF87213.1 unknown protein [Azorhizobium caulinodans ORS 571]